MASKLEFIREQTKIPLYQEIFSLLDSDHKNILGNLVTTDQEIQEVLFHATLRLHHFVDTGDKEPINNLLDLRVEIGDFLVANKLINKHFNNKPHSILSFMRERIEQEKPPEVSP